MTTDRHEPPLEPDDTIATEILLGTRAHAQPERRPKLGVVVVTAAWLLIVVAGMIGVWSYATVAGAAGSPPTAFPAQSELTRDPARSTLLVFLHPQCPCSNATLDELARVVARAGDRLNVDVVFLAPDSVSDEWVHSELWTTASSIPGVHVSADRGSREIARFDVATSGETLLYDASGSLQFFGGITIARGHSGDNIGSDALVALALTGRADVVRTAVYGCSLADDEEPAS